jgi:asparagine synthase (glutamine-hydrolysing)
VEDEERSVLSYLERATPCFERPPFNPCNHVWLAQIRERVRARGARILLTGEVGNWNISAAPNSLLADFIRERDWGAWRREAGGMLRDGRARVRGVRPIPFGAWLPSSAWRAAQRFSSAPRSDLGTALNPRLWGSMAGNGQSSSLKPRADIPFHQTAVSTYLSLDFGEYRKGILGRWCVDKRDATADRRLIEFCLSLPLTC